jgi:DNA polymerase delta subunit 1
LTFRADDDEEGDFSSQFEADLAMMDGEDVDADVVLGEGPENQQTSVKWARPDLPPINPKTDAVIFQQIDVDHYTGSPMGGMPGAQVTRNS